MTDREKQVEEILKVMHGNTYLTHSDVAIALYEADYRKADEVRKETAEDILQMIEENKFNIGKALYNQSIDDDCDVVSPYGLKGDIARKYGVKIDE